MICAALLRWLVPDAALRLPSFVGRSRVFYARLAVEQAAHDHLDARLRHILDR